MKLWVITEQILKEMEKLLGKEFANNVVDFSQQINMDDDVISLELEFEYVGQRVKQSVFIPPNWDSAS